MSSNPGVRIQYGIHEALVDAVGKTVNDVRSTMSQVMNIPNNARAHVGGRPVANDHVISQGQEVEFIKEAGVKGGGR